MIHLMALGPHVTLRTNHVQAVRKEEGVEQMTACGQLVDAIKVLFSVISDRDDAAVPVGRACAAQPGAAQEATPLWLHRQEFDEVRASLHDSSTLLPAAGRRLGSYQVGFLPVVPTWG